MAFSLTFASEAAINQTSTHLVVNIIHGSEGKPGDPPPATELNKSARSESFHLCRKASHQKGFLPQESSLLPLAVWKSQQLSNLLQMNDAGLDLSWINNSLLG